MATPIASFEHLLASSKRVLRNKIGAVELIAAYPSLKQKSLTFPSTFIDSERRLLLVLPDVDEETANISAVTNLPREQLIDKAVSEPTSLSQEEVALLKDRFWTPGANNESSLTLRARSRITPEAHAEFEAVRQPACFSNELEAFSICITEYFKRAQAVRDDQKWVVAKAALPDTMWWICSLYERDRAHWGFVCLYDAGAQNLDPGRREDFYAHLEGFFGHALQYNGSKDIIDQKWALLRFTVTSVKFP